MQESGDLCFQCETKVGGSSGDNDRGKTL